MQDFLRLTPYDDAGQLDADTAAYLVSDAFKEVVRGLQDDPQKLARLTLGMLEQFALDPNAGTTFADFVAYAGQPPSLTARTEASESTWFCLSFNRIVNFVGSFTLATSAPETALLLKAIQANLDSPRFKAAQMLRRQEKKSPRRYCRFDRVARKAHAQVMDAATSEPNYPKHRAVGATEYFEALYAKARLASDGVYNPLKARMTGRLRALEQAAFGEPYRGSYYQTLTAFALQYVIQPPVTTPPQTA